MSRKAEVKISHGQESMTKSGKVFTIFQLLQDVDGYTGVNGEVISFQPYEIFRVRRGQRGAMSVELALGEDRHLPLGISEDGNGLVVVDPIIGQTILMNWTRTSNDEQDKGLNDPAANTDSGTANPLDLGTGPVDSHWVDGGLSADLVFESPEAMRRFGDWGQEGEMSKKILACVAHNIEELREPNAFELVFRVLLKAEEGGPHIVVVGDEVVVFRLDVEAKDMFVVGKYKLDDIDESGWNVNYVKIAMSNVIRSASEQAIAHHLDFKGVDVDYKPHSKLEEQEIIEILSGDQLDGLIETILMAETSGLARKWTSSYVIRVITQPGSHAGDVIVERLRQSEEPEGRGDIYRIDIKGQVNLERHRVRFQEYEGPMFSLENIRYKSDAVFDRVAFRGGPELKKPAKPAPEPRQDNRFDEPKERQAKIPTREWIPQINQCVFIEDDPKQEMYYIADYDQADHKFLLLPADSLRRERLARQAPSYGSKDQSLHNLNGQIPVEPGRLRPFVLFH
ncbi:hypothetical protein D3C87_676120 [compost metagenome]